MDATTIRNANWAELQGELAGKRETVWRWLLTNGPATTTGIAAGTGIPLLTVRPRVSELVAWGFAECIGRIGREGAYRARTMAEVRATWVLFHPEQQTQASFNF